MPGGGSPLPRINGSRPCTNEDIYHGIRVLQPQASQVAFYPIIDAIEEFKLNISTYSPNMAGPRGTVMMIGKYVSNQFHGILVEFFRNEDLKAGALHFRKSGPLCFSRLRDNYKGQFRRDRAVRPPD